MKVCHGFSNCVLKQEEQANWNVLKNHSIGIKYKIRFGLHNNQCFIAKYSISLLSIKRQINADKYYHYDS